MEIDIQNILIGALAVIISFLPKKKFLEKKPEMFEEKISQILLFVRLAGIILLIFGVT